MNRTIVARFAETWKGGGDWITSDQSVAPSAQLAGNPRDHEPDSEARQQDARDPEDDLERPGLEQGADLVGEDHHHGADDAATERHDQRDLVAQLWRDMADEQEETKLLLVAGYAENQNQIDEAIEAAMKGKPLEVPEGSDAPPIPVDLFKGAKVKFQGTFAYSTGGFGAAARGFQSSDGVLSYTTHTIIEESPEAPPVKVKPGQVPAE